MKSNDVNAAMAHPLAIARRRPDLEPRSPDLDGNATDVVVRHVGQTMERWLGRSTNVVNRIPEAIRPDFMVMSWGRVGDTLGTLVPMGYAVMEIQPWRLEADWTCAHRGRGGW